MELSAIIREHNLLLTRPESDLVTRLSTGISAGSEELYDQRMKSLAAARDLLKRLPDRKTMVRQSNMEKAAILKERLKMLRQMIPFMSPSAVKSLNAEMKQIASQLASLSGESGGSGGAMPEAAAPVSKTVQSGGNAETAPDPAQPDGTEQPSGVTRVQLASLVAAVQADGVKNRGGNAEDRQLKETVAELKSLFNAVLAAMKRKQQSGRGSGYRPGHAQLRVYVDLPYSAGSVGVMV